MSRQKKGLARMPVFISKKYSDANAELERVRKIAEDHFAASGNDPKDIARIGLGRPLSLQEFRYFKGKANLALEWRIEPGFNPSGTEVNRVTILPANRPRGESTPGISPCKSRDNQ